MHLQNTANTILPEVRVADKLTAMITYWDNELLCRFANAACVSWYGISPEQMVGKMTLSQFLGSMYEQAFPYITGAFEGKEQHYERSIPLPNGTGVRHALITISPDMVNGKINGIVAHVADVSRLKLLEQQIEDSNRIISSQNNNLLNFANIVSHNLRSYANNLEIMLGMYEVEDDPRERAQLFGFLRDISANFKTTVRNLSDIVKVHNLGKAPLQPVNLNSYVVLVLEMLRTKMEATSAVIVNNINPHVEIDANPAFLESIILNFLDNSLKYRHETRAPHVELTSMQVGGETVLSIRDNGMGIDLEKYGHKLFGMYNTFHGNEDATGIGLYITKFQVESMGGYIGVESKVDYGTWFRIYFRTSTQTTLPL
jgi:signal transduction histidine kinase